MPRWFIRGDGMVFQPTLPVRGATLTGRRYNPYNYDFNPRSPCGERPFPKDGRACWPHFNPRSPCGERRLCASSFLLMYQFQPTLPVRGATGMITVLTDVVRDFNPRSPCGERPGRRFAPCATTDFNPRSPCGERPLSLPQRRSQLPFQPTLPVRGATPRCTLPPASAPHFNPRSPCGERLAALSTFATMRDFNPRSPCGERRKSKYHSCE